jgi:hypothetical protein
MSVLDDLTRQLGLLQTASANTAKQWAQQTGKLEEEGKTWHQAAIEAAREVFTADFKDTNYRYGNASAVQALVEAIKKLET